MGGPGSGGNGKPCKVGCKCHKHSHPGGDPCPPGCMCKKHDGIRLSRQATEYWSRLSPLESLRRRLAVSRGDPRSSTSGRLGRTGGQTGIEFARVLCPVGYIQEFQVNYGPGQAAHYKLDFAHPGAKVNIELDGPYHHSGNDHARDTRLRALGWRVIRISHD